MVLKILIADDDPVSRRVLEGTLTRMGHQVTTVAEGRSAIHELSAPDGPRLAIVDWMMPEVDGLAVCREIRRRQEPYVYVILLTARDRREDMVADSTRAPTTFSPSLSTRWNCARASGRANACWHCRPTCSRPRRRCVIRPRTTI